MDDWLSAPQIAQLAGISRQKAHLAMARAYQREDPWRNCTLLVRKARGRGGKSGEQYRVRLDSLPPALQAAYHARQAVLEPPLTDVRSSQDERRMREYQWWLALLAPALQHGKGTRERTKAFVEIARQKHSDWNNRPRTVSVRTLQRWADKYDRNVRLTRKTRKDRGDKHVHVSVLWDGSVPFTDEIKAKVAEDLKQDIRSLIANGAKPKIVRATARDFLMETTLAHGFRTNDDAHLKRICAIQPRLINDEAHYSLVDRYKRNRKAHEDSRPRFPRAKPDIPMEIVVADIHPVDILLTRADGSTATAKLIAFLDWATYRVWYDLVFIEGRGGIRNIDVIESFAGMVAHPAFGAPTYLYIDNGSEYFFAPYLNEALQLKVSDFPTGRSHIIKAMRYNPQAKPIEAFFSHFERVFLSPLPGWIGGDRMAKRQEAPGRTVAALGMFDDFVPKFWVEMKAYEQIEFGLDSELKGQSPADTFRAYVDGGWAATVMSKDEIRAACAKPVTRKVRNGHFYLKGKRQAWTCPELWRYPYNEVQVLDPAFHEPEEVLVLDMKGERLGIARKSEALHPLDERGVQRSAESTKAYRKMVRDLEKSAPKIDVAERLATFVSKREDVVPNPPKQTITFDPAHRPPRMKLPGPKATPANEDDLITDDDIQAIRELSMNNRKRMQSS